MKKPFKEKDYSKTYRDGLLDFVSSHLRYEEFQYEMEFLMTIWSSRNIRFPKTEKNTSVNENELKEYDLRFDEFYRHLQYVHQDLIDFQTHKIDGF